MKSLINTVCHYMKYYHRFLPDIISVSDPTTTSQNLNKPKSVTTDLSNFGLNFTINQSTDIVDKNNHISVA